MGAIENTKLIKERHLKLSTISTSTAMRRNKISAKIKVSTTINFYFKGASFKVMDSNIDTS